MSEAQSLINSRLVDISDDEFVEDDEYEEE